MSGTLINDLSNMSVIVNGIPISTEWIDTIRKTSPDYWQVNVPVNRLKVNSINEIRIESSHRSITGDCADIDNPANWLTIYDDSKVHISDKSMYSPSLSDFYSSYFEDFDANKSLKSNFTLPDIKNVNLISALLKLSCSVGNLYSDRNLINYNVVEGDVNQKPTGNSIVIAPAGEFKSSVDAKKLDKDQGFLSISDKSSQNPYYTTIISGKNKNGIAKSASFISNSELLKQIKDTSIVVDSDTKGKYSKFVENKKGLYVFSNWGYSDTNLSGSFHQKASFSFVQPNGLQSEKGSYINLKFRHSRILVPDRSLLTVYIDGKLVDSSKLSNSNAEDGSLKVVIPESALKKSMIKVDVEVYNYIGKIDCSKDYYDSAWTYIDSDSQIRLIPGKLGIQPSLDNFPYFNTYNESKQPEILLSFSNTIDVAQLDTASIMASRMGQKSKKVFDFDVLKGGNELVNGQQNKNMIFIGSFNNINLPDKIKDSIPILPLGNGKFKIKEGLQATPETLKNKTLVQVVRSPWNFNKRVYVVTYDNDSNLKAFNIFLSNSDNLQKMRDQISIIDNALGINNMAAVDLQDNKVPVTLGSILSTIEDKSGLPWWALLTILILAMLCIITVVRLRKKSNQFEEVGNRMKKSQGFKAKEIVDRKSNDEGKK
ncbi:cellulose biosynthesis cyclic di-GMP-binding regulatory protein BcsB [Clostridium luticellarii]|uniref:cellulose biosynthesis cyclic di-GMP-binding regulatory protein BcsB n=1 Tax=Clostridium luticellarii TaxID=1691940 RepID=UPI00235599CF|nr:cellulose biosynthesis cyclic di-GMP-binding regulatory protein BcsB [Clostridium luticellarii]